MREEKSKIYISVAISFVVGIVIGIILFYGQLKSQGELTGGYEYDKTSSPEDFFRLMWSNMLWMLSIFCAHILLPIGFLHPVMALRGCVSSFTMLYILKLFGVREAIISLFPQCICVLPLLAFFSVEVVTRHRNNIKNGCEPFSVKRYEVAAMLVLCMLSGALEVLIFRAFCNYLF